MTMTIKNLIDILSQQYDEGRANMVVLVDGYEDGYDTLDEDNIHLQIVTQRAIKSAYSGEFSAAKPKERGTFCLVLGRQ